MIKFISQYGSCAALFRKELKQFRLLESAHRHFVGASAYKIGLNDQEKRIVDRLYNGLVNSDRASLAQSITLIESTNSRKRLQAQVLLSKALMHCRNQLHKGSGEYSFRIGKLASFFILYSIFINTNFFNRPIWSSWSREIDTFRMFRQTVNRIRP